MTAPTLIREEQVATGTDALNRMRSVGGRYVKFDSGRWIYRIAAAQAWVVVDRHPVIDGVRIRYYRGRCPC